MARTYEQIDDNMREWIARQPMFFVASAPLAEAAFEEATVPEARRAIVLVDVARIGSSCGYGVPLMDYAGERPHADASTRKRLRTKGPDALVDYQQEHNLESIDGLPAVPAVDPSSV